jgi:hypothetical protein
LPKGGLEPISKLGPSIKDLRRKIEELSRSFCFQGIHKKGHAHVILIFPYISY